MTAAEAGKLLNCSLPRDAHVVMPCGFLHRVNQAQTHSAGKNKRNGVRKQRSSKLQCRTQASTRRASFSAAEDSCRAEAASLPEDSIYGKSPLFGSPWPVVIKQKLSSQSQAGESPRHGRLSRDNWYRQQPAALLTTTSEPLVESPTASNGDSGAQQPLLQEGVDAEHEDSSQNNQESPKPPADNHTPSYVLSDILYGLINAIVGAPTMISFAAIIFSDALFSEYLGQLARLAFLSSAVHQAVFTALSALPFAVGQVQDVGLIFLSSMATSIAHEGLASGHSKEDILGTTLVTITVSTFLVGVLIILVGHFRLASLVQYVPLSTVGGYLGYVGYFCLAAGLGLACSTTIDSFPSWSNLLHHDQLIKLAPALSSTAALYFTMHFVTSPLALPAVLVCIPIIFHIVLLCIGWSLADAADRGWVMRGESGVDFWQLYALFNIRDWKLSTIDKLAVIKQAPKLLALFFVVAFGSSLDVAAIQAGLADPLDFNHELKTVGFSNMISGLLGAGFTGSYIFSQTIFSMRAHVRSKLHGLIIAGTELALFAVPVSVIGYMPNFFFGSLLMLFGIEIILDWLIFSFRKVQRMEFILLWATYMAIMLTNLEAGIGIGIVLATMYFAISYARVHVSAFTVVPSRSGVVRSYSERSVLELFMSKTAALSLSGYIFFGSSVSISDQVTAVTKALVEHDNALQTRLLDKHLLDLGQDGHGNPLLDAGTRQQTKEALNAAPKFILLDFRLVHGLDATAAQSFGTLWAQLQQQGVELILTHLKSSSMRQLLEAHGVAASKSASRGAEPTFAARVFSTLEDGVQHCEEQFLEVALQYGLISPRAMVMSIEETLRSHDQTPSMMLGKQIDYRRIADRLREFLEVAYFEAGETIFSYGQEANHLYLAEEGLICMRANFLTLNGAEREVPFPRNLIASNPDRRFQFGPGSIVGTTDFLLGRPRSFEAFALCKSRLWLISQRSFDRIAKEAPEALIVLLTIIARTSVLDSMHVWEYLERINASK